MGGSGLVALSLLVLAYAAVSRRLSGTAITAAMVFVAGGILASDEVLGWLDPTIESQTVRWIAEATLTVVLFSDASRIDLAALRREYVVPLRLLAIGLPLTIVAGTLAMLGSGARPPTVAFLGWFGPRGLASIVFAVILVEDANLANESVLLNTIFLTIGLSVLLHGLTATPLAGRYARWFAAHPREAMPGFESAPAPIQRPHGWAAGLLHRHQDVDDAPTEPAS